jgi:hypothetical protein
MTGQNRVWVTFFEKKATMKTNLILAAVIAGFAATVATQAAALPCADSKHVQAQLTALHGEVLTHSGRLENSNILQLFMDERDESWSILVQVPSRGLTCMVSSGYGYEAGVMNGVFDQVDLIPMS